LEESGLNGAFRAAEFLSDGLHGFFMDIVRQDHCSLTGGQAVECLSQGSEATGLVHRIPWGGGVGVGSVKGLGRGYLPPSLTQMVGRRISRQCKKPCGDRSSIFETLAMLEAFQENFLHKLLNDARLASQPAVEKGEDGTLEAGHEVGKRLLMAPFQKGHPVFGRFPAWERNGLGHLGAPDLNLNEGMPRRWRAASSWAWSKLVRKPARVRSCSSWVGACP
jgi:hypothetical protein